MASQHKIYRKSAKKGSLRQGEIVSDLVQVVVDMEQFSQNDEDYSVIDIHHPFAIVVTQDCDLEQDFNARNKAGDEVSHRLLKNILFCEVRLVDDLILQHPLPEVKKKGGTTQKNITNNKDERFHYFESIPPKFDLQKEGIAELAIEFKHYFSVPTDEVYTRLKLGQIKRRCQLKSPYLEHFNLRFHYYHNRIALPENHKSS